MTVPIGQATVIECHFILAKVEGAGRLPHGPGDLGANSTGARRSAHRSTDQNNSLEAFDAGFQMLPIGWL